MTNVPPAKNTVFDIKKARYEIIKYGLTGFDKELQTNTKIAMAIKLGAKVSNYCFIYFNENAILLENFPLFKKILLYLYFH